MIEPYYETELGKLYHGDCLEIMPQLEPVDLVLTDPPYGLNKIMSGGTWGKQYTNSDMMQWDYKISDKEMKLILSSGLKQIVWGANYYSMPPSRCWLVWLKPEIPTMSDIEMAWTNLDQPSKVIKAIRRPHNGHPTTKPVEVMLFSIEQARGAQTILDPFLGSGTTAVACERLNRRWIGIEIEEKYCEIAAKRIENERKQLKLF